MFFIALISFLISNFSVSVCEFLYYKTCFYVLLGQQHTHTHKQKHIYTFFNFGNSTHCRKPAQNTRSKSDVYGVSRTMDEVVEPVEQSQQRTGKNTFVSWKLFSRREI
ncbi:hypothetical protein NL108_007774 [Boleophthalmus pectinirostris]|nr:hypothetical protein NL108_007774 [Boleophthalmus pectinirostris]